VEWFITPKKIREGQKSAPPYGEALNFGGFFETQAAEKTQLDGARLTCVEFSQSVQSVIEFDEVEMLMRDIRR
jgi:cytochrome c-type biogenesis protein CcmE